VDKQETFTTLAIRHDVANILIGMKAVFIQRIFDYYGVILIVGRDCREMRSAMLFDLSQNPHLGAASAAIQKEILSVFGKNEVNISITCIQVNFV